MTPFISKHTSSPSAAAFLAGALGNGYGFVVARLSSLMRPQSESPAEAAERLRVWADQYSEHQPSYAADLRAAADRCANYAAR